MSGAQIIGREMRVTVCLEPRPDGGLRAWSVDVPELVLSHRSPEQVILDLPIALSTILASVLDSVVEIVGVEPGSEAGAPPRARRMDILARAV